MPDSDTVSFERFSDEDGGVTGVTLGTGIYLKISRTPSAPSSMIPLRAPTTQANIIEGGEGGDNLGRWCKHR